MSPFSQTASLCACERGLERDERRAYGKDLIFHKSGGIVGGCADVGCFESTGDQAEEIYMNQDGRRDPALTLSALCLDRNILWFALLMLFRVST